MTESQSHSHLVGTGRSEGVRHPGLRTVEALDFILGPDSNQLKRDKLAGYLERRAVRSPAPMDAQLIESLPIPDLPDVPGFKFNYSLKALLEMAAKYEPAT